MNLFDRHEAKLDLTATRDMLRIRYEDAGPEPNIIDLNKKDAELLVKAIKAWIATQP